LSALKLHLDEDADAHALLNGLRHRGWDATSSRERGLLRCTDEEQLAIITGNDEGLIPTEQLEKGQHLLSHAVKILNGHIHYLQKAHPRPATDNH
jgi:hypothetical protein